MGWGVGGEGWEGWIAGACFRGDLGGFVGFGVDGGEKGQPFVAEGGVGGWEAVDAGAGCGRAAVDEG